jgi:3-hydroxyisobutyrate dehydrogenase
MIAWLGTGLLGANYTRAAHRRGETVRVWNRTAAKAQALADEGVASAFSSPAEAVAGVERVHLTLSDDAAVDAVLEQAAPGLQPGTAIIDHTTTSPGGAATRTERWNAAGFTFLHAPVFMGPPNALEGTGMILASGDEDRFRRLEPALASMTGKVLYLGPEASRAAVFKLMGNLVILGIGAGLADALRLADANGVGRADAAALFDTFNPGMQIPARLKRIVGEEHDHPSWELAMARKDAGLMVDAAGGADLMSLPGIIQMMDKLIADGGGQKDWLLIAK